MHSRAIRLKKLGLLTIRPLRNGDTRTVAALFDRLGPASRMQRFNGAKPRLSDADLAQLATVDARRHALVAYVDGDPEPAGLAELVRDSERWTYGEIAFAVADCYQNHRIGSTLVDLLAADARAAGITHLTATMKSSNAAAFALVRRVARLVKVERDGGEASIVAAFEPA
jgi:ribosomal protein S18 acetylase RimI-like enzyme